MYCSSLYLEIFVENDLLIFIFLLLFFLTLAIKPLFEFTDESFVKKITELNSATKKMSVFM